MANWQPAKVSAIKWWTKTLFSLIVKAEVAAFKAGQFTKLALDTDGKRFSRAYSYVNAPEDPNLEFYLVDVEQGNLSPQLSKLKEGDTVWINPQPSGFFTLDEVPASNQIWLLSTGTAIGPFLSMLQSAQIWQQYQQIYLVHGVRKIEDLSYQPLISQLQHAHPQLKFVSVVSQEENAAGLEGRITERLTDGSLARYFDTSMSTQDSQFMVCGNPDMVKEVCQILTSQGYARNRRQQPGQFTVEQYW